MGLTWSFNTDATGYKTLKATVSGGVAGTAIVTKYDGSILNPIADSVSFTGGDQQYLSATELFISVEDALSGWLEAWTGTELTADWLTGLFNLWQYTGDGTTHSWVSLLDGVTPPATNTLAFVSTTPNPDATEDDFYKLTYQLAKSVTEWEGEHFPLIEGDLSISGDAIVEVGEGLINREVANPLLYTDDKYYINITYLPDSFLKNRTNEILEVYKNGDPDKLWTITSNHIRGNGGAIAYVPKADFDSTAEYTVSYIELDKYKSTTNIQEVTANYSSSLKSSFVREVEKNSDQQTQLSILEKQVILLDARLDAGGL